MPTTYNPYGAVPEALKETRLTLRDVMTDYLNTKTQENNLRLGEAKLGVEKAAIENQIKLNELVNLRDISRQAQQESQFQETKQQQDSHFNVTSRQHQEQIDAAKVREEFDRTERFNLEKRRAEAEIKERQARGSREAQAHAAQFQKKTALEWSVIFPGTPEVRSTALRNMGIAPDTILTAPEANSLMNSQSGYFPHFMAKAYHDVGRDLETVFLKTEDPQKRAEIAKTLTGTTDMMLMYSGLRNKLDPNKQALIIEKHIAKWRDQESAKKLLQAIDEGIRHIDDKGNALNDPTHYEKLYKKNQINPLYDTKIRSQVINVTKTMKPAAANSLILDIKKDYDAGNFKAAWDKAHGTSTSPSLRKVAEVETIPNMAIDPGGDVTSLIAAADARLKAEKLRNAETDQNLSYF